MGNGRARIGLMGGSFNPAHHGHRRVALGAIEALELDELWWLVSPGNPLKARARDMAPLSARLASAQRMARRSRIRALALETALGTRYTVDTVRAITRRWPERRFVWIMGSDGLADLGRWRDPRGLARMVPIAVIARPGYDGHMVATPAANWLRSFIRPAADARDWSQWSPPALVMLKFLPDHTSATALRRRNPGWARACGRHGH